MFFLKKKKNKTYKDKKFRILILADKEGWAYDSIARSILKYSNDPMLDLDIDYIKNKKLNLRKAQVDYDLLFFMGWQLLFKYENKKVKQYYSFLDKSKVITGVHSHRSWDKGLTSPGNWPIPPSTLIDELNKYAGVNLVSYRLYQLFIEAGLKNASCTLNGVDDEIFYVDKSYQQPTSRKLIAGFSGAYKHDELKGLSEFIVPAVKRFSNIELHAATTTAEQYVEHKDMVKYYSSIDFYICSSSSEGFSLSVLEASACGKPVLSTKVGGNEDLLTEGINGYFFNRGKESLVNAINMLTSDIDNMMVMGRNNRKIVEQHWTWKTRAIYWVSFIKLHLTSTNKL